ncbi:hypothetical protein BR93DRAFT_923564 [Coniochaeta sp. PMI_546]|nr:hypothetical protein BR93DRAFT_923564 [Coniochaeta sp. PMI_546]
MQVGAGSDAAKETRGLRQEPLLNQLRCDYHRTLPKVSSSVVSRTKERPVSFWLASVLCALGGPWAWDDMNLVHAFIVTVVDALRPPR